ncbi:MAG: hypothetical protein HKP12_04745 [Gammaproteobacteria bacterium]|nr:hypothetical protein [Gammaproteobacteria bacterium]
MNSKQIGLASVGLLLLCSAAHAVSEFEQWKRQQQKSFQQYKDERDREFTEFLKEHWRAIELQQGIARDQTPKPVVIPVAKPEPPIQEPLKKPDDDKPVVTVVPEPPVITAKPPEPLVPAPVLPQQQRGKRIQVDYFGTYLNCYYDPAFKHVRLQPLSENALSRFWSELSKLEYEPLLEQIEYQARALQLNDWGYAVLTNSIALQIYPESNNKQALLTWFMLTKAGYDSRVAYDERQVYLLLPSQQQMFYVTFFRFDNERYYTISFDGRRIKPGKVYTYDGHYPGAVKKLDMSIRMQAPVADNLEKRDLSFDYRGKHYPIQASYDRSRIDYLNTYPQLELQLYFISEVGQVAESPLLQQLAAAVDGMTQREAVSFLLKFAQNAFEYRTDEQQFGEENFLFPEETLYYPYSDCEDRSVLFAWLVTELLGLEVVGLNYPGHVAAAVHLKQPVAGEHVVHNGKKFTVTDPTYINATAGMVMPGYEHIKPGVIPVR